ncbi:MAG: hypothetical protein ACOVNL_07715 [Prochlorococcaceae cyanobacterium]
MRPHPGHHGAAGRCRAGDRRRDRPPADGGSAGRHPLGELGHTAMEQVPHWRALPPQVLGEDLLWRLGEPSG